MADQVIVTWRGGVSFDAEARGHRVRIDQPKDEGGTDEGITPIECLGVSLGSCVAYFVARFVQRHGIEPEALRVSVSWEYAERPHRVGSFDVRIAYQGALDAGMRERLLRVAQGCTVHHTMTHAPEIAVTISEEAAPTGVRADEPGRAVAE